MFGENERRVYVNSWNADVRSQNSVVSIEQPPSGGMKVEEVKIASVYSSVDSHRLMQNVLYVFDL